MSQLVCLLSFLVLLVLIETTSSSFLMLLIVAHVLLVLSCLSSVSSSPLASSLVLCVGLVTGIFFSTKSLLVFFISYEFSLFPLSVLILIFGYQPENLSATLYFFSYTMICGFPLLYYVGCVGGSVSSLGSSCNSFLLFLIGFSFIVKSPIYLLHAWLPKAHVESPLLGSVALSGIILKLGGYGFIILCEHLCVPFSFFIYISMSGSIICCVICFRVHDLKAVVAYSSVVHMGVVTVGVISGSETGYWVAVSIICSHTLISPYLFILSNELFLRSGSRSFSLAYSSNAPSWVLLFLSLFWGLNFGLPPFLPFWVEVSYFNAVGGLWVFSFLPLALASFLSFLYCSWFYVRAVAGGTSPVGANTSFQYVLIPAPTLTLLLGVCGARVFSI